MTLSPQLYLSESTFGVTVPQENSHSLFFFSISLLCCIDSIICKVHTEGISAHLTYNADY